MRIAIMQPYFIPYLGYFRLFDVDLFIIYDCVQFPRRGWVHRNRLFNNHSRLQWVTLPTAYAPRDTSIASIKFVENAQLLFSNRISRFPCHNNPKTVHCEYLLSEIKNINDFLSKYNMGLLKIVSELLNFRTEMICSSSLFLPKDLKGSERILAICKHFGATQYINAPGGINLYNADEFRRSGVEIIFFKEYLGDFASVLQRFNDASLLELRHELKANSNIA